MDRLEEDFLAMTLCFVAHQTFYQHWLQAQIASENAEIAKYNQQMMLYNAAYQTYADWLNRNFMPRRPRGGSRFHY